MASRIAMSHGRVIAWLALAALATGAASASAAEDYPNRSLPFVVRIAAGSGAEFRALTLQPHMEESVVQPVIVENRTGANTGRSKAKSLEAHVVEQERDRTCSKVYEWTERFHCIYEFTVLARRVREFPNYSGVESKEDVERDIELTFEQLKQQYAARS